MTMQGTGPPENTTRFLAATHLTCDDLKTSEAFSPIDCHFAELMLRLSGRMDPDLLLSASLVSLLTGQGHVCLDLNAPFKDTLPSEVQPLLSASADIPSLQDKLLGFPVVGNGTETTPMVLIGGRLYLHKYWEFETGLAGMLSKRATWFEEEIDTTALGRSLNQLFEPEPGQVPDMQQVAAFAAATRRLTVVTGGPGTGKTFTIARMLGLLLSRAESPIRIDLAAPTGKAAARMTESLRNIVPTLPLDEDRLSWLPEQASTLHRLLGAHPFRPGFRHHQENPLQLDVLVIDEASMIDLPMMARLLQALPEHTRLILLGDKDQLASVEAGAVLGDICSRAGTTFSNGFQSQYLQTTGQELPKKPEQTSDLADSVVALTHSYRFGTGSGIAALAGAVAGGDAGRAARVLESETFDDLTWISPDTVGVSADTLIRSALPFIEQALMAQTPDASFAAHHALRILTPLRRGPYGTEAINATVEQLLRARNMLSCVGPEYPGKPIMVLQNDYTVRLFNGDMGVLLRQNGEMHAFFPSEDGWRALAPARLPRHESVYAMTVHKSQGSEFERVVLVLPDRDGPLLTRELLYTALTRAKKHVTVIAGQDIFARAVQRKTRRMSGLQQALWGE